MWMQDERVIAQVRVWRLSVSVYRLAGIVFVVLSDCSRQESQCRYSGTTVLPLHALLVKVLVAKGAA